ncbi:MAG: bifunctional diaminohydroxyphosphoribosylaminopyrimidine deaminase/5-amino-6-(5-phosphoribosylamino)uracil reductase RibD [Candidatus Binatia bacterium]|nr:bifunctional diaminohydroxyphosphoribosylaminopyrimidine deaminase/5-amino-6-(5-phosphoribosylamino)uracil reductase RibD [Candidatus Binatia bacterium]
MARRQSPDERFMRLAVRWGRRGVGQTRPNPPVGAAVVKDGQVLGAGYHRRAGLPHAEIEALSAAGAAAKGATLYVTLEPCAHHGRTPPCTEAILRAGIRRVVYGVPDPNPNVEGGGAEKLRAAGVEVTQGVAADACTELIAPFRKFIRTGKPWVTLKLAASLDGRVATATGSSRWITGEKSRAYVHRLRAEHDAVLVGAGTVVRDDPELTCRTRRRAPQPLRVVLDGQLSTPLSARVYDVSRAPTLVLTTERAPRDKVQALRERGVTVVEVVTGGAGIPWEVVLTELGRRELLAVLVEGGPHVAAQALRARGVDRFLLFLAPKLIGGDGRPVIESLGVRDIAEALSLPPLRVRRFAGDWLVATEWSCP